VTGCAVGICNPWDCQLHTVLSPEGEAIGKAGGGFNQILTHSWDFRHRRTAATPDASTHGGRRYRCSTIGSHTRAQELLRQGHTYLGTPEKCFASLSQAKQRTRGEGRLKSRSCSNRPSACLKPADVPERHQERAKA